MEKITISLENIYNRFGGHLEYGRIEKKTYDEGIYYDLYNKKGELVCMDGEICNIKGGMIFSNGYVLENLNGENDALFMLTFKEFETGVLTE